MLSASLRLDKISNELENLRAQCLDRPDKAADMIPNNLRKNQASLKELTISAEGA